MSLTSELVDDFRVDVGQYYDGRTAFRHDVRVALEPDGICLESDTGPDDVWRISDVWLVARRGPAVWFTLGHRQRGSARLHLPPRMYERLVETFGPPQEPSLFARLRPYLLPVGGFFLWVLLVVGILTPVAAEQVARWHSPEALARAGQLNLESYLARPGYSRRSAQICVDPKGLEALGRLVDVVAGLPSQTFPPHVVVIRHKAVNAASFGAGYAVLNSALIDFAENETEVIGVIAHEMGHGQGRHGLRRNIESYMPLVLANLLFHTAAGTYGYELTGEPSRSPLERQAMEREADRFAIRQLQQAELDPGKLADFMERMGEEDGADMGFFDSHPPYAERAAAFRAAGQRGTPILTSEQWRALKRICRTTKTAPAFLPEPSS